jgi:hypothetical protein
VKVIWPKAVDAVVVGVFPSRIAVSKVALPVGTTPVDQLLGALRLLVTAGLTGAHVAFWACAVIVASDAAVSKAALRTGTIVESWARMCTNISVENVLARSPITER